MNSVTVRKLQMSIWQAAIFSYMNIIQHLEVTNVSLFILAYLHKYLLHYARGVIAVRLCTYYNTFHIGCCCMEQSHFNNQSHLHVTPATLENCTDVCICTVKGFVRKTAWMSVHVNC